MSVSIQGMTTVVPLTSADAIRQKIAMLQEQLQQQAPGYEASLFHIHSALAKDEETVHLLSAEEIGTIVAALCKKKGIVLVEEAKKVAKKNLKGTTLGDIM